MHPPFLWWTCSRHDFVAPYGMEHVCNELGEGHIACVERMCCDLAEGRIADHGTDVLRGMVSQGTALGHHYEV